MTMRASKSAWHLKDACLPVLDRLKLAATLPPCETHKERRGRLRLC